MKILPIIFCAIMLFCFMPTPNFIDFVDAVDGIFYFYTTQKLTGEELNLVPCGNGYIISCDREESHNLYQKLNKQKLLGISIDTHVELNKVIKKLDLKITRTQELDSTTFLYGYTNKLKNFIVIDGEKVNIQIAQTGDTLKIGYPLILDSA